MSCRILYIEEHEDDETPCVCSNCDWSGKFGDLDPVTDGALTAGEPSFAGRCPECDCVAYLDRPQDRAEGALRHLIWSVAQGYPAGDSNLDRAVGRLECALEEACPGFALTINLTAATAAPASKEN